MRRTAGRFAQAGLFCGAGGYGCCPAPSCQPSCGCTSYKVERQTCYRTVYERVCHPETYTVNTTVSETVYDHHPETCYRMRVQDANTRTSSTRSASRFAKRRTGLKRTTRITRSRRRSIANAATPCRSRFGRPNSANAASLVAHNVVETIQQECCRTVVDRVTETINTDQCSTVTVPVTTYSTVQRDCGQWVTQTVQHPGPVVNQCVCDPCTGCMKTCQVQCPGFTTCCRVWVPKIVTEQVPCTTYKCEVVHKTVPVQVVRCVPRTIVEKVPVAGLQDGLPGSRRKVPGPGLPLCVRAEGGKGSLLRMPPGLRDPQPSSSRDDLQDRPGSPDVQSGLLRAGQDAVHG